MKLALKFKPFMTYEADIYYHLGLAYCRLQKFEKSIYPYSRCIEKIPSDLRYIHERAKAYQMIEEHEKAVSDFHVVITKNPKNAHAYFRMAFSQKALKVSEHDLLCVTLFNLFVHSFYSSTKTPSKTSKRQGRSIRWIPL